MRCHNRRGIRGGYLFPHQFADDLRRGFVVGYSFSQQVIRRKRVNRD
jgi:hypothetical protein